jgi:hypothetical protein
MPGTSTKGGEDNCVILLYDRLRNVELERNMQFWVRLKKSVDVDKTSASVHQILRRSASIELL